MEAADRFLGVDIGNSGLRIAELDIVNQSLGKTQRIAWRHSGAYVTSSQEPRFSPDSKEWLEFIAEFIAEGAASLNFGTRRCVWLISSVRRDALHVLEQFVRERGTTVKNSHLLRVITRHEIELSIDVLEPDRVGVDRLLAASAAAHLFPQRPLIVMQVGSALTVDLVRAGKDYCDQPRTAGVSPASPGDFIPEANVFCDQPRTAGVSPASPGDFNPGANVFCDQPRTAGVSPASPGDFIPEANVFCGGAILPGFPMMLRLLGQAADQLPSIEADELTELPPLPGRNTEQAMRCGTASALVGGAQHVVQRYRQIYGADTQIILSGGDGLRLAPHLSTPLEVVPHLVLRGLIPIAKRSLTWAQAGALRLGHST